jgi:hypothetical protein
MKAMDAAAAGKAKKTRRDTAVMAHLLDVPVAAALPVKALDPSRPTE